MATNPFFPQQGLSGNALLGTILLGGSALGRAEPGYVTEARQRLRNLTSPEGFGSVFNQTVGGLESQFAPRLQQLEEAQAQGLAQRVKAAFPAQVGLQGPEIGSLLRQARDEFLPQRQAFLGQLGLQGIGTQAGASQQIVALDRPDPFKEALAGLGGSLIASNVLGGGGGLGGGLTGNSGLDQLILNSLGGGGGGFGGGGMGGGGGGLGGLIQSGLGGNQALGGPINMGNLLRPVGTGGLGSIFPQGSQLQQILGLTSGPSVLNPVGGQAFTNAVSQQLGGATIGGFEQIGGGATAVLDQSGNVIGQVLPNGQVVGASGPGFFSMSAGTGEGFLAPLGTFGGLLQGAGVAAAGFGTGNLVGQQLKDTRAGGTAAGVGAGAASGAVIGTFLFPGIGTALGAAIGAIAGGIGGFFGSSSADHAFKAERLASDQRSQANTVSNYASFWTEALGASGFQDLNGWSNLVQQTSKDVNDPAKDYSFGGVSVNADQPDNLASIGSQLLLKQLQQGAVAQGKTPPASLNDIPGFRDRLIEFVMNNTFIESEGQVRKPENIQQKGSLITRAGLPL